MTRTRILRAAGFLAAIFLAGPAAAAPPRPEALPRGVRDEFFIVTSLDLARGTIVVKRPTEVTLVLRVTASTRCRSENGRPLRLSDLRAGDTIYVAWERDPAGQLVARTVREGVMTVPELKRRYLRRGA